MDINAVLEKAPAEKSRKAEEAENLRLKWQKGKEILAKNEAKFALKLKAERPDLKATEIKAEIEADDKLYYEKLLLLEMEANYRKKEIEVTKIDDFFTGAKKLAQIKIGEMSMLDWTGKRKGGNDD